MTTVEKLCGLASGSLGQSRTGPPSSLRFPLTEHIVAQSLQLRS